MICFFRTKTILINPKRIAAIDTPSGANFSANSFHPIVATIDAFSNAVSSANRERLFTVFGCIVATIDETSVVIFSANNKLVIIDKLFIPAVATIDTTGVDIFSASLGITFISS